MKKIILFLLITCLGGLNIFAALETPSTQGHEFYFSFIRALPGREKTMVLTVSAAKSGRIVFTDAYGTETVKTFAAGTTDITLAHLKSVSINNPDDAENGDETEVSAIETLIKNDPASVLPYCYTIRTNVVQDRGYMVKTYNIDDPTTTTVNEDTVSLNVSLYAGLSGSKTVDVANVYPIDALGNEYFVLSHPGDRTNSENIDGNCEALIVATEDNTTIEIIPTCLLDNQTQDADLHGIITITLNKKGQTYQLRAQSPLGADQGRNDLTGTIIRVKDDGNVSGNKCKRIAVFAGTQHGNPGDYEYEQIFPKLLWGKEYLVSAPDDGGISVVRVGASEPCTHVKINGIEVAVLNQTDFYDYVDVNSTGAYVETDKPVQVGMFTRPYEGQEGDNISQSNDAAMIVIAPIEQRLDSIVFSAIYNVDADKHYVSITTPTQYVDSLFFYQLSGGVWNQIPLSGWDSIPANKKFSSVVYRLTTPTITSNPTYKLISKKGGFNAYLYGYGANKDEYGYSVGSAALISHVSVDINGVISDIVDSTTCMDKTLTLTPILPANFVASKVDWDFDADDAIDQTTYANNNYTATYTYPTGGLKRVKMIVYKEATCFAKTNSDTKILDFQIKQYITDPARNKDTMICKGVTFDPYLNPNLDASNLSKLKFTWATKSVSGTDSIFSKNKSQVFPLDHGEKRKYWRSVYNTDNKCDVYVDTFNVTITPIKGGKYTLKPEYCRGETVVGQTTVVAGQTPTYQWYDSNMNAIAGATSKDIVLTIDHGTITTFYQESSAGCMYKDTFNIKMTPIKGDEYTLKPVYCSGDILVGQTTIVAGNTPSYQWFDSNMNPLSGQTSKDMTITNGFGTTTKFYQESTFGCMYKDTFNVAIPTKINNSLTSTHGKVCGDGNIPVTITATIQGDATNTDWTVSENGGSFDPLLVTGTSYTYNPVSSKIFKINSSGVCENNIVSSVEVDVNPPFVATLDVTSDDFVSLYTLPISGGKVVATVETTVPGSYLYTWSPQEIIAGTSYSDKLTEEKTYQVLVKTNDTQGQCSSLSNTITVKLGSVDLHTIIIPNSKNSKNRTFADINEETGETLNNTFTYGYKLTIFNRYGQIISTTLNGGWDGTYKGKVADAGVYFYVLEYNTVDGSKQMKGSIEVIK